MPINIPGTNVSLEPPAGTIKPADEVGAKDEPAVVRVTDPLPDTLSINTIRQAIESRAREATIHLGLLRQERTKLNANIKRAVAEETEARRLLNALKPRQTKSKAAK